MRKQQKEITKKKIPQKQRKRERKHWNLETRQTSKVKLEISSNKTWKINTKMSVTGRLQMKPTIKGPSTDPGTCAEMLEG